MGLFDRLTGKPDIKLSPQGGLLLAAITMIAIDGNIDEDEISIIHRLDREGGRENFDKAFKAWKTNDISDCVSMAADAMNRDQQLVAIANLIDIAMADGMLVGDEKVLLESYVNAFDVNQAEIEKIVDVISVKNNSAIFQS